MDCIIDVNSFVYLIYFLYVIYYVYQFSGVIFIQICPFLEASFQILGKKWNGLIIHYLSLCKEGSAHFTDMKRDLPDITPRALSLKLSELIEYGLIEKKVVGGSHVTISYELTEKGRSLAEALQPIQKWGQSYLNLEPVKDKKEEETK